MKYIPIIILLLAAPMEAQLVPDVVQPPRTNLVLNLEYLEGLRARVRAEHPSIAAAQGRIKAADAAIRSVRLWEDPMAGVRLMAAEKEMRMDDGDVMVEFEQALPRRGLYHAEKSKMKAERSMYAAELRATQVKLETLVAQTAVELALAQEMIAIDFDQVQWLDQMAFIARERLKDPMGNASEALRIESELAQERQKLGSNRLMQRRFARQLNILLGRPVDDTPQNLRLPESALALPALEKELSKIASSNPMLWALQAVSAIAESDVEIAKAETKPVFSVGADTRVYSGGDFREASIGAKMTIPLFNRSVYRARITRAKEQHEVAQKQIEAVERELRSDLVMALTDAESAADRAAAFTNEVIPRAEKAAESVRNAWISGQATLLEVLEARRAVLAGRLEERRQIAAQTAALETLRSIVPPPSTQ